MGSTAAFTTLAQLRVIPAGAVAPSAPTASRFFAPDESATTDFSSVAHAHTQIVDQVVEVDEALMELYLEQGEELEVERLHDAFEQALREGHLMPVCFTCTGQG